jgi:hypothetical protein
MKHYFRLQLTMLNRQFTEMRINPIVGYLFSIFAFIGISLVLFSKTEYANYIYLAISLILTQRLSEVNRTTFLKICFIKKDYIKLRLIENLLSSIPFFIFLIFKSNYISALFLMTLSCLLSFISLENKSNFTLPTPFKRTPFEFIIGFRKSILLFVFCFVLGIISIRVNNFNLGAFSVALTLISCITFYFLTENEFYVWVYSLKSKAFIFHKIKILFFSTLLLTLPLIILLIIFFPSKVLALSVILALGILLNILFVLMKYSIYPLQVNIKMGILMFISFNFFPSLLITIPYLYKKTINNLKTILE